jgi:hypothetical protein
MRDGLIDKVLLISVVQALMAYISRLPLKPLHPRHLEHRELAIGVLAEAQEAVVRLVQAEVAHEGQKLGYHEHEIG